MEIEDTRTTRRKIEGMLVNSHKQLRLTFVFVGGGVLLVALLSMIMLAKIRKEVIRLDHSENIDPEITYPILNSVAQAQVLIGTLSAMIFCIAIWRGFRLSHRIWGPVIPLRRHVEELSKGNYKTRINLRPGDEFVELAEDLNQLAKSLEKSRPK